MVVKQNVFETISTVLVYQSHLNMKKKWKLLLLFISLLLCIPPIQCDEDALIKVITPKNITEDEESPKQIFSKSYIQKFSTSWHVYAKANDIAKREKLKKALKDALTSISSRKKSEIITDVDHDTVNRIKDAAALLKEFKKMYSLSENVKRTLENYNEAKSNLSSIAKSNVGYDLLKKFLVAHHLNSNKRNHIPTTKASFIDQLMDETDDSILKQSIENDLVQKRSYINSIFRRHGSVFGHFRPIKPVLSKSANAFKKARIVLNFMKKKYESNPTKVQMITQLIDKLNTDMTKISPTLSANQRKSDFPNTRSSIAIGGKSMERILSNGVWQRRINNRRTEVKGFPTPKLLPIISFNAKDFPQPADVRAITSNNKTTTQNPSEQGGTGKNDEQISTSNNESNEIIKSFDEKNNTLSKFIQNRKKTNPYVEALLRKIAQKLRKRKEILSLSNNHQKYITQSVNKSNTTENATSSKVHSMSHEEQEQLSKDILNTLNENDNLASMNASQQSNNNENSSEADNRIEESQNNKTSNLATPTSEMEILQRANDENYSDDTIAEVSDSRPNENNTITKADINMVDKNESVSLDGNDKTENEILKRLNNFDQQKLIEKIKELEDDVAGKKSDMSVKNDTIAESNSVINPNPHPKGDYNLLQKQKDTMQQLKEAKQARAKYEIAKHELAQKVKELYLMANDYEKQETSDQILEVKNFVTDPKAKGVEQYVSTHNVKRDEDHPGIALSGIQLHATKNFIKNDDTPKAFTMGMTDKNQHAIDVKENKPSEKIKKMYGLPSALKLEEINQHAPAKKSKSQEETLKVIAQAIQEDMEEITKNEQKKKILKSALTPDKPVKPVKLVVTKTKESKPKVEKQEKSKNTTKESSKTQNSKKKGLGAGSDKIDEYLTKALAEFMGNDTLPSPLDHEKETEQKEDLAEKNRRIVENAMRQHAKNPNLPLPLVKTKGDAMELNKINETKVNNTFLASNSSSGKVSNDIFSKVSDQDKSTAIELDPSDKVLLDKATHMEEQIALAQDKLYAADNSPIVDPPPAPQPVEYTPPIKQPQNIEDIKHLQAAMFSHIANAKQNSMYMQPQIPQHVDPYGSIRENADTPPHGFAPVQPMGTIAASALPQNNPNEIMTSENAPQPLISGQSLARASPAVQPSAESPEDDDDERDEDDRDEEEDEEEDDRLPPPAASLIPHHHQHHKHHPSGFYKQDDYEDDNEPEDDEEEDDDDDEDEKKSRVRYRNDLSIKRTLQENINSTKATATETSMPTEAVHHTDTNDMGVSPNDDDKPLEELEDSKRMVIPN